MALERGASRLFITSAQEEYSVCLLVFNMIYLLHLTEVQKKSAMAALNATMCNATRKTSKCSLLFQVVNGLWIQN